MVIVSVSRKNYGSLMLLAGIQMIICSATVIYRRRDRLIPGERYETGSV